MTSGAARSAAPLYHRDCEIANKTHNLAYLTNRFMSHRVAFVHVVFRPFAGIPELWRQIHATRLRHGERDPTGRGARVAPVLLHWRLEGPEPSPSRVGETTFGPRGLAIIRDYQL
jgi:hypothetical protein